MTATRVVRRDNNILTKKVMAEALGLDETIEGLEDVTVTRGELARLLKAQISTPDDPVLHKAFVDSLNLALTRTAQGADTTTLGSTCWKASWDECYPPNLGERYRYRPTYYGGGIPEDFEWREADLIATTPETAILILAQRQCVVGIETKWGVSAPVAIPAPGGGDQGIGIVAPGFVRLLDTNGDPRRFARDGPLDAYFTEDRAYVLASDNTTLLVFDKNTGERLTGEEFTFPERAHSIWFEGDKWYTISANRTVRVYSSTGVAIPGENFTVAGANAHGLFGDGEGKLYIPVDFGIYITDITGGQQQYYRFPGLAPFGGSFGDVFGVVHEDLFWLGEYDSPGYVGYRVTRRGLELVPGETRTAALGRVGSQLDGLDVEYLQARSGTAAIRKQRFLAVGPEAPTTEIRGCPDELLTFLPGTQPIRLDISSSGEYDNREAGAWVITGPGTLTPDADNLGASYLPAAEGGRVEIQVPVTYTGECVLPNGETTQVVECGFDVVLRPLVAPPISINCPTDETLVPSDSFVFRITPSAVPQGGTVTYEFELQGPGTLTQRTSDPRLADYRGPGRTAEDVRVTGRMTVEGGVGYEEGTLVREDSCTFDLDLLPLRAPVINVTCDTRLFPNRTYRFTLDLVGGQYADVDSLTWMVTPSTAGTLTVDADQRGATYQTGAADVPILVVRVDGVFSGDGVRTQTGTVSASGQCATLIRARNPLEDGYKNPPGLEIPSCIIVQGTADPDSGVADFTRTALLLEPDVVRRDQGTNTIFPGYTAEVSDRAQYNVNGGSWIDLGVVGNRSQLPSGVTIDAYLIRNLPEDALVGVRYVKGPRHPMAGQAGPELYRDSVSPPAYDLEQGRVSEWGARDITPFPGRPTSGRVPVAQGASIRATVRFFDNGVTGSSAWNIPEDAVLRDLVRAGASYGEMRVVSITEASQGGRPPQQRFDVVIEYTAPALQLRDTGFVTLRGIGGSPNHEVVEGFRFDVT